MLIFSASETIVKIQLQTIKRWCRPR